MQQMAGDLHAAYVAAASAWNAANPGKSRIGVALVGDAWVTAMNLDLAQTDPFTPNAAASGVRLLGPKVDLWDGDPLQACCTAPIGYHPSIYGAYLDALTLFGAITGIDPVLLGENERAARDLGIGPVDAVKLQVAAEATLAFGHPVSFIPPDFGSHGWTPQPAETAP